MFNLEQAIASWRKQLTQSGVGSSAVLDELESHLCEEIRKLESAGIPQVEAFQLAVSRLGDAKVVADEFGKITLPSSITLWLGLLLGSGIMLVMGGILFAAQLPGKPSFVLLAHTLTLTVGDILAFFAGGLGICYICSLKVHRLSPAIEQSLCRTAALFNQLSACLVLAGLFFGMVWSEQNRGRYLSADPGEIGTFCSAIWLAIFCLIWRFGRIRTHTTMLLCVGGNLIISLGWFGAGLLSHGYGIGHSWQLNTALVVNFLFLAWGLVAAVREAETKRTYV